MSESDPIQQRCACENLACRAGHGTQYAWDNGPFCSSGSICQNLGKIETPYGWLCEACVAYIPPKYLANATGSRTPEHEGR